MHIAPKCTEGRKVLALILTVLMFTPLLLSQGGLAQGERPQGFRVVRAPAEGVGEEVRIQSGPVSFSIRYGVEGTPNPVSLVSFSPREIAVGEFYGRDGRLMERHGIPVETVFIQRFTALFEFRDANANGLLDMRRVGDDPYSVRPGDPIVKAASLSIPWVVERFVVSRAGTGSVDVEVALTGRGIPYRWFENATGNGTLDRLTLVFHIHASISEGSTDLPEYRLTAGENGVVSSSYVRTGEYTGARVDISAKYDILIAGWDFTHGDSMLAFENSMLLGNFMKEEAASLLKSKDEVTDENAFRFPKDILSPELIIRNMLVFGDGWHRVGRFLWATNVTVDGRDARVRFQVHWGMTDVVFKERVDPERTFLGFKMGGAFIYPQGGLIVHDPEYTSTAIIVDLQDAVNAVDRTGAAVELAVALILLSGYAVLRLRARRTPAGGPGPDNASREDGRKNIKGGDTR